MNTYSIISFTPWFRSASCDVVDIIQKRFTFHLGLLLQLLTIL